MYCSSCLNAKRRNDTAHVGQSSLRHRVLLVAQWLAPCAIHYSVGRLGSCVLWILDRRNGGTWGSSRKNVKNSEGLGRFVAQQIMMAPCRFSEATLF